MILESWYYYKTMIIIIKARACPSTGANQVQSPNFNFAIWLRVGQLPVAVSALVEEMNFVYLGKGNYLSLHKAILA